MIKLLISIYLVVGLVFLVLSIVNVFDDIKGVYMSVTKHWQKIAIIIGYIVGCIPFIILGPVILMLLLILIIIDKTIQIIRGV